MVIEFSHSDCSNRSGYFSWKLLDTDLPAEEILFSPEDAVQWIAGASNFSRDGKKRLWIDETKSLNKKMDHPHAG